MIHERLRPVLLDDPLDITLADASPWDVAPDEERLFWRIVYLIESSDDGPILRDTSRCIVECLARTSSPTITHELFPLLLDQSRLCAVVAKHMAGLISRTSFLSVLAESGYPDHIKLWLQAASHDALVGLCERLATHRYDHVAEGFEVPPD